MFCVLKLLPTWALFAASCYLHFSLCFLVCQVGLPSALVASITMFYISFGLCFGGKNGGFDVKKFSAPVCYNGNMPYIRKYKTTSGATGVQVCYKEQGKVVKTIHVGSASSEKALTRLTREAQDIIDGEKKSLFNLNKYNKKWLSYACNLLIFLP